MKKIAQLISMEFSLFWNGKISLAWMYWFFGVLIAILIHYGAIFISVKLHFIYYPYAAFWAVGTWRSANNYKGRRFWANLTKLIIILPIIGLVALLFF